MFLVYVTGTNSKLLHEGTEQDIACPMCEGKLIHVAIYQRYHHVLYVPFFPLGKYYEVRCLSCTAAQQDCATPALIDKYSHFKTHIRYWSGTLLLVLLAGILTFSVNASHKREADYALLPLENDIYSLDDSVTTQRGKERTLLYFKIRAVKNDSINIIKSKHYAYHYSSIRSFIRAHPSLFDKGKQASLSKKQLLQIYKSGKIGGIYRTAED